MLWINVVNKFVIPMIIKKKNENYLIFKFYIVWRLKLRSCSIEKYQHKNKERKI